MAYDEVLAARLRAVLAGEPGLVERRMFGGVAFLLDGHLAASASGRGGLLLRCAPGSTADLLAEPHVAPFEMRGRAMTGWLHVAAEAVTTDDDLRRWVAHGTTYARGLPPRD